MKYIRRNLIRLPAFLSVAYSVVEFSAIKTAHAILTGTPYTTIQEIQQNVICNAIANWLFDLLIVLTVVYVIIAAYKYLTSSGDPNKVSSATKTITFAAIAIVVALLAKAFPFIIANLFGVYSLQSCY